jgi:hypothetical protein
LTKKKANISAIFGILMDNSGREVVNSSSVSTMEANETHLFVKIAFKLLTSISSFSSGIDVSFTEAMIGKNESKIEEKENGGKKNLNIKVLRRHVKEGGRGILAVWSKWKLICQRDENNNATNNLVFSLKISQDSREDEIN